MELSVLANALDRVRTTTPLVHNITNYVTVNDCANALLAVGASPIMSDEPADVEDITSLCGALALNIGTLNERSIKSMFIAGKRAQSLGHAIVLDPVGAGASTLRTKVAKELLDTLPVTVMRGNMSEIKALAGETASTYGVDVCPDDVITQDNIAAGCAFARDFAAKTQAVVAITGAIDIIADAARVCAVHNGTPLLGRITGSGCMLTSICAAFVAANPHASFEAIVAAVVSMGLAGQIAQSRMNALDGNGSFRTYLLDALFNINGKTLEQGARIEEFFGD